MQKHLTGILCALVIASAPLLTSAKTTHKDFSWPTESSSITQYFVSFHDGIDIDGDTGDSVTAAAAGKVLRADCSEDARNKARGCYVVLQNGKKWKTVYENLDSVAVTVGERVTEGQVIATVGNTGRSTGSHLHFEMRKKKSASGKYRAVNPLSYLNK